MRAVNFSMRRVAVLRAGDEIIFGKFRQNRRKPNGFNEIRQKRKCAKVKKNY